MVGNDLNILPRKSSRFPELKLAVSMVAFLVLMLTNGTAVFSQNLHNTGSITNTGTIRVKNQATGLPAAIGGRMEFFGGNQTIPTSQYMVLVLSGNGTKQTSGAGMTVTDTVSIANGVVYQIDTSSVLVLNGTLLEQGYLLGKIQKSVNLSGGTTSSPFGNIGATIGWTGTAPGLTTVTRASGIISTGNGKQSIKRYYDINSATNSGLNTSFIFKYNSSELNGQDSSNLQLWKSTNGGSTWEYAGGVSDTFTKTITQSGISSFGRFTVSDTASNPLGLVENPVRLIVRNYLDLDGSVATISDRTAKPWAITIRKDSLNGTVIASVISDTILDIHGLENATYFIQEPDTTGYTRVGYQIGNAQAVISSTNTVSLSMVAPQTTLVKLFTFKNGSISGLKFRDDNVNGVKDGGEGLLSGWKIRLAKNGNAFDSVLTAIDGSYSFSNLGFGAYVISEEHQSGWLQTFPTLSRTYTVNLQSGQNVTGQNFGNYQYGIISGTFFNDANSNTVFDLGEAAIVGRTIRLYKNSVLVDSALSSVSGTYSFANLLPGTYSVSTPQVGNWITTAPPGGQYTGIAIASGSVITSRNFGNYLGGSITGLAFYDRNNNSVRDIGEGGLTAWMVTATANTPANTKTAVTNASGIYLLPGLFADHYTISLESRANWTQTYPPAVTYSIDITTGLNISGYNFGTYSLLDSLKFRTFRPDSLLGKKAVLARPFASSFQFTFVDTLEEAVNGLVVVFTPKITSIDHVSGLNAAENVSGTKWMMNGVAKQAGDTVVITGSGGISGTRVKQWWWMKDDRIVGKKNTVKQPDIVTYQIPMPNSANVRDAVFRTGFGTGLTVGISKKDSTHLYAWVRIRRSLDLFTSLLQGKLTTHTGTPRGFSVYNTGARFIGEVKVLPPSKQNNKLFAELVALKVNLQASLVGLTPAGFGELVYEEAGNPLSGLVIKNLASHADSMMTFYRGNPASVYLNLDTTVRKINSAFSGPLDTLSFVGTLCLNGVRAVNDVPFLRLPANIDPVAFQKIIPSDILQTPEEFMLYQNYPNPFNPTTTIEFELPGNANVTLRVFNSAGQEIITLLNDEELESGMQQVEFDASDFASGVYFYKLEIHGTNDDGTPFTFTNTKKMMHVK